MPEQDSSSHAIVVLPTVASDPALPEPFLRWLSRGEITRAAAPVDALLSVLDELGNVVQETGKAALRLWGQTGTRPGGWLAAADPVCLVAGMHSVSVQNIPSGDLSSEDADDIVSSLNQQLAADDSLRFSVTGQHIYLHASEPLATSSLPARQHRILTDEHLPRGDHADSHNRLLGEVQLLLHEHPVNERRAAEGKAPVNSLWLWGGGRAPDATSYELPLLISDDPLMRGYWLCGGGAIAEWNESGFEDTARKGGGFVAVFPESLRLTDDLADSLVRLTKPGAGSRAFGVTVLFLDGVRVELARSHRLRFWRGISKHFRP